jgi:hypothetical protein
MFIDESIRDSYVMAGVFVASQHLGQYRRAMGSLRTKGSNAFHMGNERRQHRSTAITVLRDLDYIEIRRVESKARFQDLARRECLQSLTSELDITQSWTLILDRSTHEELDRKLLFRARAIVELSSNLDIAVVTKIQDYGVPTSQPGLATGP